MTSIPTTADVAKVAELTDLVIRNREVTRGYFLFSRRFQTHLGDEMTWPTLATWASSQAGRTIRKEDLLRTLERRLGDSDAIRRIVEGPLKLGAKAIFRALLRLNPFERSSQAVSRGNIKVYAEIGRELARFLTLLESTPGEEEVAAFADSLRPGPPPDGQDHLKGAFRAYHRAVRTPAGKERSEWILFGNLSIGYHEQTRLQPEIEASVDGSAWDAIEVKERLFDLLLPGLGGPRRLARAALEPLVPTLVNEVRVLFREIVTASLMVLELPGEVLRLGQDLSGEIPAQLRAPSLPQLRELVAIVDPAPDSLGGSGTRDWTSFPDRMHFIADLFRSRQYNARLFERPVELGV